MPGVGQGSDTVSLRITLRYKSVDEFVDRYAENVSSAGLFIRTKSPKPTGTKIRFELLLADGSRALRGEGVVVTVRKEDKPGMALRFNLLDADSQAVVDRTVSAHGQGALAPTPLSTTFARSPSATDQERRPASIPGWRPTSVVTGWSSRSSSVLPRSPSKTFDRDGGKPLVPPRRAPSGPGLPRVALPRTRSSVSRPWASTPAVDQTDKIRLRSDEDQDPKTERIATPLPEASEEKDRTQRLEVSEIERHERAPQDRGDTVLDPPPQETPVREAMPRGESLTPEEIAEAVLDTARSMADEPRPELKSLTDVLEESEEEPETSLISRGEENAPSLGSAEVQMEQSPEVSAVGIDVAEAVLSAVPREAIPENGATAPDAATPEPEESNVPEAPEEPEQPEQPEAPKARVEPEASQAPEPDPEEAQDTTEPQPEEDSEEESGEAPHVELHASSDEPPAAELEADAEPKAPEAKSPEPEAPEVEPGAPPKVEAGESLAPEPEAPERDSWSAMSREPADAEPEREMPAEDRPMAAIEAVDERPRAEAVATTEAVADTPLPLKAEHPVDVDWSDGTDPEETDEAPEKADPEVLAAEGTSDPAPERDLPSEAPEATVDTADTGDLPVAAPEEPVDTADTGDLPGQPEGPVDAADTGDLEPPPATDTLDVGANGFETPEEAPQVEAAEPHDTRDVEPREEAPVSDTKDLENDAELEAPPMAQEETLVGLGPAPIPAASRSEAQEAIAAATNGLASARPDHVETPSFDDEVTDSQEVEPRAPAYLAAETLEHVHRPEVVSNVSLDAATEVVSAYDASAPAPSLPQRPMISTEVSVTGMNDAPIRRASSSGTPASRRPSKPRIAPHRTIVEKDASHVPDPAEELERAAKEAAFSEEATLVPPERRAAEEARVVVSTPDEPRASKGPDRVVGIDLGARWVRIGSITGQEFELIPAGDTVYIPALVAAKRDGTLALGAKARAIALEEPNRAVAPRAALHALATGAVNPRRAAASRIISYEGGSALLRLGEKTVPLQEILVAFFGWLESAIRAHLGTGFRAVVSVPNDLDPEARMMLKRACTDAGLRIARLESEPNAAIRAYNLVERTADRALLVDLGATHLGISLMQRDGDEFRVAAGGWFDDLSARDLDAKVAELTLEELREQAGEDHSADPSARERLIEAAERARLDIRRAANLELKVTLPAPGGASGVVVERTINLPRSRIYAVTEELIVEICGRIQQVMRDAGVDPRLLGAVILAGSGGSYPPLVEALQNLTTLEPLQAIHPTHLFAQGLARRGMALERQASADLPNTLSASIGLELPGGRFRPLLNAGDRLPARLVRPFPTRDGQTEIDLRLFQGDAELVRSCTHLGLLHLPDVPRKNAKVELEMKIDLDGILDVTLSEETSGLSQHIRLATQQTPDEKKKSLPRPTAVLPDAGVRKKPAKGGLLSRWFGRR